MTTDAATSVRTDATHLLPLAAAGVTVVLWASAFIAIRSVERTTLQDPWRWPGSA